MTKPKFKLPTREVKFRAWDKRFKKMVEVEVIDWGEGRVILANGERADLDLDVVLLEYTGLKDKNGKPIYEGDIIEETIPVEHTKKRAVVVWHTRRAKWVLAGTFRFGGGGERELANKTLEVLGNVFENPELLEEKEEEK